MQIIPRIQFRGNCKEAIEVYQEAFGATIVDTLTYGNVKAGTEDQKDLIMNAHIDAKGNKFQVTDNMQQEITSGNQISFTISMDNSEEVKATFNKLKIGGKVIMEPMETFFSPCHCAVSDKFNITWQINCPK